MENKRLQKKINVRSLDGTYKRKTIYAFNEKELIKKSKQAIKQAEQDYQYFLAPKFDDVAYAWNEHHETEIEHYTFISYQAPLKNLIAEFGATPIANIKPLDVQRFINNFAFQGYAKQTIKLRLIAASQIFDYAIMKGYIDFNPTTSVKVPRNAPKSKRELPSDADIEVVKKSYFEKFGNFLYLVLYTGCRREEALALTYEDIDFNNNTISINKVVIFKYGKPQIRHSTKSQAGLRTVPLLEPLKDRLPKNEQGYIFKNKDGELLTLSEFNILLGQYKKTTGITSTTHQFRHAFATFCYDAGLSDKDTANILGHSKIELTKNIYIHIQETRQQQSANKLNNLFKSS